MLSVEATMNLSLNKPRYSRFLGLGLELWRVLGVGIRVNVRVRVKVSFIVRTIFNRSG